MDDEARLSIEFSKFFVSEHPIGRELIYIQLEALSQRAESLVWLKVTSAQWCSVLTESQTFYGPIRQTRQLPSLKLTDVSKVSNYLLTYLSDNLTPT